VFSGGFDILDDYCVDRVELIEPLEDIELELPSG
jgi:hypothetical protein